MDSLMFLAKLCPSLPIIWKLLWLVGWPVWLLWWWMAEGAFRCSLYLSPKVLEVSPMYSLSQPRLPHWYQYVTTLVDHRVFVFGEDQEVLNGSATFEVGSNAIPTTDLFDAFTKTLCIGYDNVTLIFDFIGGTLGTCGAPISSLSDRPVESFLHLVQSQLGIFAFSESLPEIVLFLLEQPRLAAHCGGPVGEGMDYTKFGWEVMVTVPL